MESDYFPSIYMIAQARIQMYTYLCDKIFTNVLDKSLEVISVLSLSVENHKTIAETITQVSELLFLLRVHKSRQKAKVL